MEHIDQTPKINGPKTYQIKVNAKLDEGWSDWLEGMAITFELGREGSEITVFTGRVIDQTALHGILNRIRDLNVPLLSVQLVPSETESGVSS